MRNEDVLKVTDQERLYAFAAGDPKAEVRKRAAVRLKDDAAKKSAPGNGRKTRKNRTGRRNKSDLKGIYLTFRSPKC